MAISDELNRIIQAKADIKSALAEKGLTIGDSSTLDEYPALIQEMETGGGGSSADTQKLIDMIEGDITSIVIPSGVKKIGHSAFMNRKYLTSVQIPSDVSNIEMQAFSGCTALRYIDLPSACTKISVSLLSGCLNLESFVVKDTVTEIDTMAFNNIGNNVSFAMLPTIPPTLQGSGSYTFGGNNSTWPIYVKKSVVNDYKTAGGYWNDVSTRIQALADFSFSRFNNTVTATGRDTLKLYVDSSLCNSNSYTFEGDDSSHIITVESYDASLGLLDSLTGEVYTPSILPSMVDVKYNLSRSQVTEGNNQHVIYQKPLTVTSNTTTTGQRAGITYIDGGQDMTVNTDAGNITYLKLDTPNPATAFDYVTILPSGDNSSIGGRQAEWWGNASTLTIHNSSTTGNIRVDSIISIIQAAPSDFDQTQDTPLLTLDTSTLTVKATSSTDITRIYNNNNVVNNPYYISQGFTPYTLQLEATAQNYGELESNKVSENFQVTAIPQTESGTKTTVIDATTVAINDNNLKCSSYTEQSNYATINSPLRILDDYNIVSLNAIGSNSRINKYPSELRIYGQSVFQVEVNENINISNLTITYQLTGMTTSFKTPEITTGNVTVDTTAQTVVWSDIDLSTISTIKNLTQMKATSITIEYQLND